VRMRVGEPGACGTRPS